MVVLLPLSEEVPFNLAIGSPKFGPPMLPGDGCVNTEPKVMVIYLTPLASNS